METEMTTQAGFQCHGIILNQLTSFMIASARTYDLREFVANYCHPRPVLEWRGVARSGPFATLPGKFLEVQGSGDDFGEVDSERLGPDLCRSMASIL